jgi:hypothetical protein
MDIIKNIRLIALIALVLASGIMVVAPLFLRGSGVLVSSLSDGNRCSQIGEGDVINSIEGTQIKSLSDFDKVVSSAKKGDYFNMVVNGLPAGCTAIGDGDIGISVAVPTSHSVNFGIDIQGGTITTLSSSGDLQNISDTIQNRIALLGIPQAKVAVSGGAVQIYSLGGTKLSQAIVPGDFEAKISEAIIFANSTGQLKVGNDVFDVIKSVDTITINGTSYSHGEKAYIDGLEFTVLNVTNSSALVEAKVFDNSEVTNVLSGYVQYNSQAKRYEYFVPLGLSQSASDNFLKVTKGIGSTPVTGGQLVLQGQLVYYMDGAEVNRLNIPYSMTLEPISSISIVGFENDQGKATNQMNRITALLDSGILPNDLKIIGTSQLAPKYMNLILYLGIVFAIALSASLMALTFLRYRRVRIGLFSLAILGSEALIIIGAAALTQVIYSPGWIIDMDAVVGIMSIVSIGAAQLLMIPEKALKKKDLMLNYSHKGLVSLPTLIDMVVFVVSFVLLFTPIKGIGLAMLLGAALQIILTRPMLKGMLGA